MPSKSPTTCTLCLKPASIFGTLNFQRHEAIRCNECGEFAISDSARKRIGGLPIQFKDDWRAKIKATDPQDIFLLTVGPLGSGSQIEEARVCRHKIQSLP
jgi:hypothetical protein